MKRLLTLLAALTMLGCVTTSDRGQFPFPIYHGKVYVNPPTNT